MDTTFTSSKNSKTSEPHRLLPNLANKTNLREVTSMLLFQMEKYK